jgi:hypothetical protein
MSKRQIHFLGFLANVDDSIVKLNFGEGFRTEKMLQRETGPFLQKIDFYYKTEGQPYILSGALPDCYCIINDGIDEYESTPQGGVVAKWGRLEKVHTLLSNKIKLLRLYKKGDIFLRFSFLYFKDKIKPSIFETVRENPLGGRTIFSLKNHEIPEAQNLVNIIKIPFQYDFLQLAFDSFNLSYETNIPNLLFLSLMMSMEALFNPGSSEIAFQISRNAAVLLGKDKNDAEQIFKNMKKLYGKRSNIVHGSKTKENKKISKEDIIGLREYVRQSIKEIYFIGKDKDEVIDILNSCGFGQQPWKN